MNESRSVGSDSLRSHGLYGPGQNTEVGPYSRGSSQPRDGTQVSCICRLILYQLNHKKVQDQREKAKYARSANGGVCPTYPAYSSPHLPIRVYPEPSFDFTANFIQSPACI